MKTQTPSASRAGSPGRQTHGRAGRLRRSLLIPSWTPLSTRQPESTVSVTREETQSHGLPPGVPDGVSVMGAFSPLTHTVLYQLHFKTEWVLHVGCIPLMLKLIG